MLKNLKLFILQGENGETLAKTFRRSNSVNLIDNNKTNVVKTIVSTLYN